MKKIYSVLPVLLLAVGSIVQAQTIENIKAVTQGSKVIITFDILNAKPGQDFNVQIFSSHNGFGSPLTFISGDVGSNVKPGTGKRAEWDAQGELHNFSGDITFEVRGEPSIGWGFKSPTSASGIKRGKSNIIAWTGGAAGDNVKLELLNNGKAQSVGETKNNGQFSWDAPADLAVGGGYQMRLTSGSNTITSEPFSVKHKIPTLLKLAPVILIAALIPALSGGGKKEPGGVVTPPAADLPSPPDPQ